MNDEIIKALNTLLPAHPSAKVELPWAKDDDERRRAWVIELVMINSNCEDIDVILKEANLMTAWLRDGKVPDDPKKETSLKVIK